VDINPLTHNDDYSGRTAPLTSKRCILYIYSTNIGTKYFKNSIYSPFFLLQNAGCFINLTYLVLVLFTFYIHGVLKLKKNSGAKRLNRRYSICILPNKSGNMKLICYSLFIENRETRRKKYYVTSRTYCSVWCLLNLTCKIIWLS